MSGFRVSNSIGAVKALVEDAVLLAQKEEEIKHLKEKNGRLELALQDKDKRLRKTKESLDRRRALNPSLVNLIEDKWKREVKDKKKLVEKVDAEGKALLKKAEAAAEPETKKWMATEDSNDETFRTEEKQYDAVFEHECVKIGKRVREQLYGSPGKGDGNGGTPREKASGLDSDNSDNDEPAPKQAKKGKEAEKGAELAKNIVLGKSTTSKTPVPNGDTEPHPGTLGIKAPVAASSSSSRPKGGKAAVVASKGSKGGKAPAKPDPKPKAAAAVSKGITKPAGPKGKKEQKNPRSWYAIWMQDEGVKAQYAAELEEVLASGDADAIKAFPQPIKDWYPDAKKKLSTEEVARFEAMSKKEKEEWIAKGWKPTPKKTSKASSKKPAKKAEEDEDEEAQGSGSDSEDDQDTPMDDEEESEAESEDEGKKGKDTKDTKDTKDKKDKKGEKGKEGEKGEKGEKDDPFAGTDLQAGAGANEPDSDAESDKNGDDKGENDEDKPEGKEDGDKSGDEEDGNDSDSSHSPSA
jgi:hypothetical protein